MAEIRITAPAPDHSQIAGVGANDHHTEAHDPEDHTGQGATAPELEVLTDGSEGGGLHVHTAALDAALAVHAAIATSHQDAPALIATHAGLADPHTVYAMIATGTYTGDGGTSQGITGVGFAPKVVWVTKQNSTVFGVGAKEHTFTTDVIVDDNAAGISIRLDNTAIFYDQSLVISLDADGFTVDDDMNDDDPNADGIVYNFLAIG